jgi:hypothetical protein
MINTSCGFEMLKCQYPVPATGSNTRRRLFKSNPNRIRFDFEIGHLVKSPCKDCTYRPAFPRCIDSCLKLDRIHNILSESISCTRRY